VNSREIASVKLEIRAAFECGDARILDLDDNNEL
jgi:hypothetical protein